MQIETQCTLAIKNMTRQIKVQSVAKVEKCRATFYLNE